MIPFEILQNKNNKSLGSLIAVLNLTIERAPTIPNDTVIFDCIDNTTADVIIDIKHIDILNFLEYITLLVVNLYMKYTKSAIKNEYIRVNIIVESDIVLEKFDKKLSLKISLKLVAKIIIKTSYLNYLYNY